MHCPLYRLLLLKHKELPMEKQQDIMFHSKDSLISRTTKSDSFNWPSLCHLSPFHLPYVKAGHVACQNVTLTGLLTLTSHFKLSRAMKIIVFGLNICLQSGLTTNCVRNYPIKNATRIYGIQTQYCAQICRHSIQVV